MDRVNTKWSGCVRVEMWMKIMQTIHSRGAQSLIHSLALLPPCLNQSFASCSSVSWLILRVKVWRRSASAVSHQQRNQVRLCLLGAVHNHLKLMSYYTDFSALKISGYIPLHFVTPDSKSQCFVFCFFFPTIHFFGGWVLLFHCPGDATTAPTTSVGTTATSKITETGNMGNRILSSYSLSLSFRSQKYEWTSTLLWSKLFSYETQLSSVLAKGRFPFFVFFVVLLMFSSTFQIGCCTSLRRQV